MCPAQTVPLNSRVMCQSLLGISTGFNRNLKLNISNQSFENTVTIIATLIQAPLQRATLIKEWSLFLHS